MLNICSPLGLAIDLKCTEPSPVYQCKKALRRNIAVKYSATLSIVQGFCHSCSLLHLPLYKLQYYCSCCNETTAVHC